MIGLRCKEKNDSAEKRNIWNTKKIYELILHPKGWGFLDILREKWEFGG